MENNILLKDFQPKSTLKVKKTKVRKPKFSIIDTHCHFRKATSRELDELTDVMDNNNIKAVINIDGGIGDRLKRNIENFQLKHPGRIYTFCNLQITYEDDPGYDPYTKNLILNVDEPDFNRKIRKMIKDAAEAGAKGIKLFKDLGLKTKDSKGNLVLPDDDRLRVIWETAAEENIFVLYHIADPVSFFQPINENNERYETLIKNPAMSSFYGPGFPSHGELMESQRILLEKNPDTFFIFAHVLYPENLEYVSQLMNTYENFAVDLSARVKEMGRQPYTSRKFLINHSDRIFWAQDGYPNGYIRKGYFEITLRYLETYDEYFDFRPNEVTRWKLYGVHLPDEVLKRIYHKNAEKILRIK